MEDNVYKDLVLMKEGTPLGSAWKEFVTYSMSRNVELLARAETEQEIFRLQGRHRLYKEMLTLPETIKRNNEHG